MYQRPPYIVGYCLGSGLKGQDSITYSARKNTMWGNHVAWKDLQHMQGIKHDIS